jgi:hypothetical protein
MNFCEDCEKRKVCSKRREMTEVLEEINDIFCEEINVEDDIEVLVKCRHFVFEAKEENNKKRRKKKGEEDE